MNIPQDQWNSLPAGVNEARRLGAKFYYTGKPCKNGNIAPRLASAAICRCPDCKKEECNKVRERQKAVRELDGGESARAYRRQWAKKNPDKVRATKHRMYERIKLGLRPPSNMDGRIRRSADRTRAVALATPPWANRAKMREIYYEAHRRRLNGEKVEVDHIHPIKGVNFCGLHVEWNLQIMSRTENLKKGNRLVPAIVLPVFPDRPTHAVDRPTG